MTYVVYKYQNGKKLHWSASGKWVKTAGLSACYTKEQADAKAREVGGMVRLYASRY